MDNNIIAKEPQGRERLPQAPEDESSSTLSV
jgi:hypothetical protein